MPEMNQEALLWIFGSALVAIVILSRLGDKLVSYVLSIRKGSNKNTGQTLTTFEHDTIIKIYDNVRRNEGVCAQNAQLLSEVIRNQEVLIIRNQEMLTSILNRMERNSEQFIHSLVAIAADQRRLTEACEGLRQHLTKGS